MTRILLSGLLLGAIWLAAPLPADAQTKALEQARERVQALQQRLVKQRGLTNRNHPGLRHHAQDIGRPAVSAVPELDPNAAGGALALLLGGTMLAIERRRQTKA